MKKRYKYKPDRNYDDLDVIREFAAVMEKLEEVHKCPVRLVKTAGLFSRYAVYELIENKEQNNDR